MAVVMPPGRPYVLPAALWPTYAAHANDAADLYAQAGTGCAQEADDSRATAARLGMLTEGLFSEAMQTAHQRLGVAHDDHKEICGHLKNAASETADILNAYAGRLDRIDEAAHQEISASPPEARDGIIAAAQAAAVSAHDVAAADIGRLHGRVAAKVTPLVAGIGAPAPAAPAPPDTQAPGGSAGDPAPRRDSASAAVPPPRSRHSGDLAARGDADNAGDSGASGNNGDLATRHDPSPPLPPLPVSPLGGFGGGGSAGSGSGLGGGGLGSGLGGGPLSSLMGGLGPNPASSGVGQGDSRVADVECGGLDQSGGFRAGLVGGDSGGIGGQSGRGCSTAVHGGAVECGRTGSGWGSAAGGRCGCASGGGASGGVRSECGGACAAGGGRPGWGFGDVAVDGNGRPGTWWGCCGFCGGIGQCCSGWWRGGFRRGGVSARGGGACGGGVGAGGGGEPGASTIGAEFVAGCAGVGDVDVAAATRLLCAWIGGRLGGGCVPVGERWSATGDSADLQ